MLAYHAKKNQTDSLYVKVVQEATNKLSSIATHSNTFQWNICDKQLFSGLHGPLGSELFNYSKF